MSYETVSDDELEAAFEGTNFGTRDHRQLLEISVLKKAVGYHCGHTITTIMRDLRLIGKDSKVLRRGQMLREAFHDLMIGKGG